MKFIKTYEIKFGCSIKETYHFGYKIFLTMNPNKHNFASTCHLYFMSINTNFTKPLKLEHEIFVLDATLVRALNRAKMKEITTSLITDLLKKLGMEELAPLGIYQATDLRAPGWSFIQPITTSHISGHYFEEETTRSHIHMDIYSCKHFEWQDVINLLHKHLELYEWNGNFIIREMGDKKRKIINISGNKKKYSKI